MLEMALQSGRPDVLQKSVTAVVEQIEHTIRNLQGIITDLRPAALDELGLAPAVETLVERARRLSGLEIELAIELPYGSGRAARRLEPHVESAAYRLVQEALNNVVKHAGARSVEVAMSELDDRLIVTVRDDGTGFEPSSGRRGFGIVGMRERVALVNGRLEIESRPGRGTTVRAELPVLRRGARPTAVSTRSA
jgi:signal transduction histidine kinase